MPKFRYRAKEGTKNVDGVIEAQSKSEALEKIHQLGQLPMYVEMESQKESPASAPSLPAASSVRFSGRVRAKDVTLFTWQLASMIKSGVPIMRCLQIIGQQSVNPAFKGVVDNIQNAVKDGKPFSSALAEYPHLFSSLYIAMVHSGESSGTLQDILLKIAEYRQKQEEIMSRVRTALAYPILMSVVGAGTIFFMFTFVMPKLMKTFSTIGQELPTPTKILLAISSVFQKGWIFILIGLAAGVVLLMQALKKKSSAMFLKQLQLKVPILGEFTRKNELARFCRTLEMLLKSGVPILRALEVATPVLDNEMIQQELRKSYNELKEGGSLGKSLERSKFFPVFMSNLIIVGEESGRLADGLGEIANAYTRDTEESIKVMTSLLEPIIILIMGLIVGFIVFAMLLPIFEINSMVK